MQRTKETEMAGTQELDFRSNTGLEVALLWEPETNRVSVSVFDSCSGDDFTLEVDPAEALHAFHHPYALAATRGVLTSGIRSVAEPIIPA
jgi:hypothetical protein